MLSAAFALQDQVMGERVEDVGIEDEAQLGQAVAMDGDLMVVGAPHAEDRGIYLSGAAFVYRRNDNNTPDDPADDLWEQESRLTPGAYEYYAEFGASVAISGGTIVVGSPNASLDSDGDGDPDELSTGAAFVFQYDSTAGEWSRQQMLIDDTPDFHESYGWSVGVSDDTIVVGNLDDDAIGSVDVFTFDDGAAQWNRQQTLTAADPEGYDEFGYSVAIADGRVVVGSRRDDLDTNGDGAADWRDEGYYAGSASVFAFDSASGEWKHEQLLTAADPDSRDEFGYSVAISGEKVVVGSRGDDLDLDGDGEDDDGWRDEGRNAGAAYVFAFDSTAGVWSEQQKLTATGPHREEEFGASVSISGGTLVVGAPREDFDANGDGRVDLYSAGAASVFAFDDTSDQWSLQQTLAAGDPGGSDAFGSSVAISGGTLLVGSFNDDVDTDGDGTIEAPGAGSAYVFESDGSNWTQQQKLVGVRRESGPEMWSGFGHAVAIDGDLMVVGASDEDTTALYNAGAAYVYRRNDNGTALDVSDDFWQQEARLTAADPERLDYFGASVAISGETVLVGSTREDFDTDGDGAVDAYDAGSVSVFTLDSDAGGWTRLQTLTAGDIHAGDHNDEFGSAVAIADGRIVVGSPHDEQDTDGDGRADAYNAGSAYVFTFDSESGLWAEEQKLSAADADGAPRPWYSDGDLFGSSVAISGGTIAVGSPRDSLEIDDDGVDARLAGSVYVFDLDESAGWGEQEKLTAAVADDYFAEYGSSVAISGGTLVVGSRRDSVDTHGDGTADADNAGSADVFTFDSVHGEWTRVQTLTAASPREYEYFGGSVAISGRTIVVGSRYDDVDLDGDGRPDAHGAGSASVFLPAADGRLWSLRQTITPPDIESGYNEGDFGRSVAISGGTIVVGNSNDDVDTDGDGVADVPKAGSAFVFVDPPPQIELVEVGDDLKSFVVQLNDDDLHTFSAEDPANYRITAAGADAVFGADDVTLAVDSVSYDPAADRLVVRTVDAFFGDFFRLEIDSDDEADNTNGVTDIVGNYLAGGDFTADFDLTALNLVGDLLTKVEKLELSTGAKNSLTGKLDAVLTQLEMDAGDEQSLTAKLDAFINGVNHCYEKDEITLDVRDDLVEDAELILLGFSLA